jgi:cellobiose phosphorylase
LQIAPVIPAAGPGVQAKRLYRGVTYDITVKREGQGNVVSLKVDGKVIEGNVIPVPGDGTQAVKVEVTLK